MHLTYRGMLTGQSISCGDRRGCGCLLRQWPKQLRYGANCNVIFTKYRRGRYLGFQGHGCGL